jgi:CRISPR-associated protein Csm4
MTPYRITLALRSPLGTPLAGDTLFGQICHAAREATGDAELTRLLDGYPAGQPWLVVGDGLPAGHLPRPTVPTASNLPSPRVGERPGERGNAATADRKAAKSKHWIPLAAAALPLPELLAAAVDDTAAYGTAPIHARAHHNTLNRLTGTTGKGEFAPYTAAQIHHAAGQQIDIWCVLDDTRCTPQRLVDLLAAIGATGFGRDASIGLGKFDVLECQTAVPPAPTFAYAHWTLGPCAPQGQGFDGERSFWRVLTRFGRHGGALALSANPFKNPVLLAAAGTVLVPPGAFTPRLFVGQGLSGVSHAEPATVHQGYAPVLPLQLEAAP